MAVATKWLAPFLPKNIRYSPDQRKLILVEYLHAAATIAVILIGYNMKIVDENVLNGTIILILVTCMTGSFVTANAVSGWLFQEQRTGRNHNVYERY